MKIHSPIYRITAVAAVIVGLIFATGLPVGAAKDPIPAGCPGSTRSGPPAPAPNGPKGKTICDTIPAGCPGSSHQGKPKSGSQCPYASVKDSAQQIKDSGSNGTLKTGDDKYKTIHDTCGGTVDGEDVAVDLSINIGCKGVGNPIADATFAIIRFLSAGAGLVIVGSIIVGGIQYTGSRGDPQATAMAVNRIRSSLYALLIFIFAYAILNYLIPAGFLKQ